MLLEKVVDDFLNGYDFFSIYAKLQSDRLNGDFFLHLLYSFNGFVVLERCVCLFLHLLVSCQLFIKFLHALGGTKGKAGNVGNATQGRTIS